VRERGLRLFLLSSLPSLFVALRTNCHRAALNATDLCAKSTAYDRFRERVAAGVFLKRWQVGVEPFDERKGIDWDRLRMAGAMSMAPLGEKNRPQSDRLRESGHQAVVADRGAWRPHRCGG